MKWAKIPTEFLFKLNDREIAAVAKYCMLYGLLERVPTQQELNKWLTSGQLETLLMTTSEQLDAHLTILETLEKYLKGSAKIAQYDRERKNQKKAEICGKEQNFPTEIPKENSAENPIKIPTEKNQTDKIRENRESNTSPNGNVLQRASARATNPQISPPDLETVFAFAKEQNSLAGCGGFKCDRMTAEEFWSKYSANGWRECNDARTPIVDWCAKLRQWSVNEQRGRFKSKIELAMDDIPDGPKIAEGDN